MPWGLRSSGGRLRTVQLMQLMHQACASAGTDPPAEAYRYRTRRYRLSVAGQAEGVYGKVLSAAGLAGLMEAAFGRQRTLEGHRRRFIWQAGRPRAAARVGQVKRSRESQLLPYTSWQGLQV